MKFLRAVWCHGEVDIGFWPVSDWHGQNVGPVYQLCLAHSSAIIPRVAQSVGLSGVNEMGSSA